MLQRSKETTPKTHPVAKPAESTHKASRSTISPMQQPAWTQAMGNHPPLTLQLKRAVSQPDDRSEEEMERVAEQVVSRKSSGQPLPAALQHKMETAFGQDFSHVRIHEGTQAASIGALAYTRGTDIHFAPGAYQPESTQGQALLGHELTHVVQQRAGRVQHPQGKGVAVNADPVLESEADRIGAQAAQGNRVKVSGASTGSQPASTNAPIQMMKLTQPSQAEKSEPERVEFGSYSLTNYGSDTRSDPISSSGAAC